jgi:CspA family cold shock protein
MSLGLAELFKDVFSDKLRDQCAVYDYAVDFSKFWEEDQVQKIFEAANTSSSKALIIVWGDFPDDTADNGKLLAPHLTPLDWALAFSIKVLEDTKLKNNFNFSIHIIDLTGGVAFKDAWAVRMRHQLCADMPWMRLHAPLIPIAGESEIADYRTGYQPILANVDVERMVPSVHPLLENNNDGWSLKGSHKTLAAGFRQGLQRTRALKNLAKQWAASLTQSDDHHDLNNLLGPSLLIPSVISPSSGLESAFHRRLRWTGLAVDMPGHAQEQPLPTLSSNISCDFLALDDCLGKGWADVLCDFLGLNPTNPRPEFKEREITKIGASSDSAQGLWGFKSADKLIDKLQEMKDSLFYKRDYQFRYQLAMPHEGGADSQYNDRPEILFLDLRLFETPEKQKTQIGKLLELARSIDGRNTNLAWPAFKNDELSLIEKWLNEKLNEKISEKHRRTAEAGALTLLPRLLALATPCTPIIIFSSTNRADIKEKLHLYRNVFTGFAKPRPLSAPESVLDVRYEFCNQVDEALKLAKLDCEVMEIMSLCKSVEQVRPSLVTAGTSEESSGYHVECYFDESGSYEGNNLVLTCLVVIYRNESAAKALHKKMDDNSFAIEFSDGSSLKYGTRWIKSQTNERSSSPIPKHPIKNIKEELEKLLKKPFQLPQAFSSSGENYCLAGLKAKARKALEVLDEIGRIKYSEEFLKWVRAEDSNSCTICTEKTKDLNVWYVLVEIFRRLRNSLSINLNDKNIPYIVPAIKNNDQNYFCGTSTNNEDLCKGVKALFGPRLEALKINYDLPAKLEKQVCDSILDLLKRNDSEAKPAIFCIHAKIEKENSQPGAEDNTSFIDAKYDETIGILAETAVHDIAAEMCPGKIGSYRLFFATRNLGSDTGQFDKEKLQSNYLRWGMSPNYSKKGKEVTDEVAAHLKYQRDEIIKRICESIEWAEEGSAITNFLTAIKDDNLKKITKKKEHSLPNLSAFVENSSPPATDASHRNNIYSNPKEFLASGNSETYGVNSYGGLARGIHFRRAQKDFPKLNGAVAVRLNRSKPEDRDRHIHNLVDWAPRAFNDNRLDAFPIFSTHFEAIYKPMLGVHFRWLLDACASIDRNNSYAAADAILKSEWRPLINSEKGFLPIGALLLAKASRCFSLLKGDELMDLSQRHDHSRSDGMEKPALPSPSNKIKLVPVDVKEESGVTEGGTEDTGLSPPITEPELILEYLIAKGKNADDAKKSIVPKVGTAEKNGRIEGKVKWFNSKKGYGFLSLENGEEVFVHFSAIQEDDHKSLNEGETVEFEVFSDPKGPKARNVRKLKANNVTQNEV